MIRQVVAGSGSWLYEEPPAGRLAAVVIHVKTVSEANSHTHWRERQERAGAQRKAAYVACLASWRLHRLPELVSQTVRVHLTRLGARKLDGDNLQGALKHVRDGIADWLVVDDGDESKVTWTYDQEPGHKVGAVRVELYRKGGV